MMNNAKSPMIAGVLGIVLGSLGVHQWYLGDQTKAKRHLRLFIVGLVLLVAGLVLRALLPSILQLTLRTTVGNLATVARTVAWIVIAADVVWGAIEGVLLLIQGDKTDAAITNNALVNSSNANGTAVNSSTVPAATNVSAASAASATVAANPVTSAPAQPGAQPATTTAGAAATVPPAVPPAPTNTNLTFDSHNIQNPQTVPRPDQAVGTKDVAAPDLTVAGANGKEKLNPVVKRWLLSGGVLIAAAVGLVLLLKFGFDAILSSAYGETYRAAKEIKPLIEKMHNSSACEYAVQYAKSAYVDRKTYDGYVDTCESLITENTAALIAELGKTPMLRWSGEIARQYQDFQESYAIAFPAELNLAPALQLYQTWHNYVLAVDLLTLESEDVAFQEAADILRTSGNSTLAQYGEIWLEKELEYIHAYRDYQNTSYTDPNKDALRETYETLRGDLQAWVADHRPDVLELEKVTVPNTDTMYDDFTKMYDSIRSGYEKHYDRKSGDCNNSGRTVYCN